MARRVLGKRAKKRRSPFKQVAANYEVATKGVVPPVSQYVHVGTGNSASATMKFIKDIREEFPDAKVKVRKIGN